MADTSVQICYFLKDQCINKLFSVTKLPNLINRNTKQYRKPLARSLEHWGIATLFSYYGLVNLKKNTKSKGLPLIFLAL